MCNQLPAPRILPGGSLESSGVDLCIFGDARALPMEGRCEVEISFLHFIFIYIFSLFLLTFTGLWEGYNALYIMSPLFIWCLSKFFPIWVPPNNLKNACARWVRYRDKNCPPANQLKTDFYKHFGRSVAPKPVFWTCLQRLSCDAIDGEQGVTTQRK